MRLDYIGTPAFHFMKVATVEVPLGGEISQGI